LGDEPHTLGDLASLATLLIVSLGIAGFGWLILLWNSNQAFGTQLAGVGLIAWPSFFAACTFANSRRSSRLIRLVCSFVALVVTSLLVMVGIVVLGYTLE
jgi:hypothetical protein